MAKLDINGKSTEVDTTPDTPLLYVLRDNLAMNGAKFGCGLGQCGACTVLVDNKPVLSCVVPISVLEGRKITTLEGIGTPEKPGALQRAFIEEQAAQCGYCTAGMIVKAQGLLNTNKSPTDAQIREHMSTNLCRCGTHNRVIAAVKKAAGYMRTATTETTPGSDRT
jgi:nicotinate dehydrogenase subunit A